LLGYLRRRKALVHEPNGLIVLVFVQIALTDQKVPDTLSAEYRPMVLGDHCLRFVTKCVRSFAEVF
jgi:hypothetical protein